MKKLIIVCMALLTGAFFYNCEDAPSLSVPPADYVTFEDTSYTFGVDIDGTNTRDIMVYSTRTGVERTVNINVVADETTADAAAYTVPSSVTIGPDGTGTLSVTVSDTNIGESGKTLVLEMAASDEYFTGEKIAIDIQQVCGANDVSINFIFDGFGSEVTWEVYDSSSTVVASGGPYADGDTTASASLCIANGSYQFVVYDSFGDGLSFPADGSITIVANGEEVGSISGNYGAQGTIDFTL